MSVVGEAVSFLKLSAINFLLLFVKFSQNLLSMFILRTPLMNISRLSRYCHTYTHHYLHNYYSYMLFISAQRRKNHDTIYVHIGADLV